MKLQIQNLVVDLSIVETINSFDKYFNIILNNGRVLEFYPKPISFEGIFSGTIQEVNNFIRVKRQSSMDMTNQRLKELFKIDKIGVKNGEEIWEIYNQEEIKEKEQIAIKEVMSLYDWVKDKWKDYRYDNVKFKD